MDKELVYIGKIVSLTPIPNADFIVLAEVVCGHGGKWKGVVRKEHHQRGELCFVYLPDSIISECESMSFLKNSNWRVKMARFKGVPSEVVITPYKGDLPVGTDVTMETGVKKYVKQMPANLAGIAKGNFPDFIPKTDEPNFQRSSELIEALIGRPYYITEKMDGSSTTAYKWKGKFGVCSRNLELKETEKNGYWKVANKYDLRTKLPEGYAIQWETCGPGIQKNPLGLPKIEGFAFSGYDIENKRYLTLKQLEDLCNPIGFPIISIVEKGDEFHTCDLREKSKGNYSNGKQREGIVVRSQFLIDGKMISFKAINLDYKDE